MQFVHTRFFCSLLLINLVESFVFTLCMINKVPVYGAILVLGTYACNSTYSHGEMRPLWTKPHQVRFCLGYCLFRSGENITYCKSSGTDESHLGFVRSSATVIQAARPPTSIFDFPQRPVLSSIYLFWISPPSLPHLTYKNQLWGDCKKSFACSYNSVWLNPFVNNFSCMTEHVLCGRHFYEVA